MSDTSTQSQNQEWTTQRLQDLIDQQMPENFRLDYKGRDALPLPVMNGEVKNAKRQEIGKDATAFANSDGGVIIYGIREETLSDGRPVPVAFEAVSLSDISQDQLTQIIASNAEPTLVGVRVLPVQAPNQNDPSKVCFVVIVPPSNTAHMASDGCYYFRNEATTGRMRDWQVRDAMNRKKYPDVTIRMEIHPRANIPEDYPPQTFRIIVTNIGRVIARNYCGVVRFPMAFNGTMITIEKKDSLEDFYMETADGLKCWHWTFSNNRDPLFPGMSITKNVKFRLAREAVMKDSWGRRIEVPTSIDEIRIVLFADEMPARIFDLQVREAQSSSLYPVLYSLNS